MSEEGLSEFLNKSNIPIIKEDIGFLEIIKKPHNETINSNIYAHFLSCNDNTITEAFLSALLELITDRTNREFKFSKHYVNTELSTNEGRIDIVIRDLIEPTTLIIENKIFHWLHNSLLEYWNYFKIENHHKIGVLLTVNLHHIPNEVAGAFVNITHWEWIQAIKNRLNFDEIKEEANKVYLKDFFNSIKNLSTTYTMNASAKFFFEHAFQINRANQTLLEGHKYMLEQYQKIASLLGLETYGNDIDWKNFWDEDNTIDTYITVAAQDIISGRALRYKIIIEVMRNDQARLDEIVANFKDHFQYKDKERGQSLDFYTHFLVKEYEITIEDLGAFADHVVKNIKNDFGDIFVSIVEHLYPPKIIESWKQNLLP